MEVSALEQSLKLAGHRFIAGCDEAGRGALAGPVVAAAVVLSYGKLPELLMDSKRLTRRRRELVSAEIKEQAVANAVFRVEPREIEQINILQASLKAMARAVDKLGMPVDAVLVDGNFAPRLGIRTLTECIVGGDRKIACIAAASVLAKVERDFIMEQYARQYPKYHFERHKGYPTEEHLALLKRYGPCRLHRRTFKPVKEQVLPRLFKD
jgi:ribonuclease HII